jgi:Uri superfamily endonuclease
MKSALKPNSNSYGRVWRWMGDVRTEDNSWFFQHLLQVINSPVDAVDFRVQFEQEVSQRLRRAFPHIIGFNASGQDPHLVNIKEVCRYRTGKIVLFRRTPLLLP